MIASRSLTALTALAWLALAPGAALAQSAKVTATVDRTTLPLHEELELSVAIEGAVDRFEPPKLDGFSVQSEGTTRVINGRQSSLTRTFRLRPQRAGRLTIGPARAYRGGKLVAQSQPISVLIAEPKAARPVELAAAQDLRRHAGEGLFVRLFTPRKTFYVGEPFPLTLQVYFRTGMQITSVELVAPSKLDGLLVEEIGDPKVQKQVRRGKVGQLQMSWYPLSQQLATPLRPGRLLVDAATVRLGLSQGLLASERRYTRATQPYWIDVREVPKEGRPETFDEGNLGRFRLSASLTDDKGRTPKEIRTGERLVLRVEVSGEGNLLTLKAPRLQISKAFDVQPLPSVGDDELVKNERGMHGRRTFQYLVTPLSPGAQTTPTVTLSFFDPQAARFITRQVKGSPLRVTGDRVSGERDAAAMSGEDVGPIIEEATLARGAREPLATRPLFWLLLALPLLGYLIIELRWRLAQRDRANPGQRQARAAYANSKKRLRAADQALRDGLVKDFYGQIARTLLGYLEERANIPAAGMTHDQLRKAAQKAGYPAGVIEETIVELENCDFARFAPQGSASDKMRETRERTGQLLRALDKTTPKRRP